MKKNILLTLSILLFIVLITSCSKVTTTSSKGIELHVIQIGDLHGHLIPRPNLRYTTLDPNYREGGLARIYSKVEEIRAQDKDALLFNVGDTIQGGAEALFTKGIAMIEVLDHFGINGFAPGNWDFLYGTEKFIEYFASGRWGAVAANIYYDNSWPEDKRGKHILPPYRILEVKGLRIGVMGLASERGLPAVPNATKGMRFTSEGEELPEIIKELREEEKVDLVFLVSEFGLAKNIAFGEKYPGMDVILSADMHEETQRVVVTKNGTLVSEVGQDGTKLAHFTLKIQDKKIIDYNYQLVTINNNIPENTKIAALVAKVREPFVTGTFKANTFINPFNDNPLTMPIDSVVGTTKIPLYRSNYTTSAQPALVQGSSHNFIAEAFREQTNTDIGMIRGFRYGTHILPGAIKLEDLYHYIPIGPQIATGTVTGQMIKTALEKSAQGSTHSDVFKWKGGWLSTYAGVKFDFDPYASFNNRIQNIKVKRANSNIYEPIDFNETYSISGYYYSGFPKRVGDFGKFGVVGSINPLKNEEGGKLGAIQVLVSYLKNHEANPDMNRIRLFYPLPKPAYGNPEMQPLKGIPSRK